MSEENKEQSKAHVLSEKLKNSAVMDKATMLMGKAARISSVLVCVLVAGLFFLLFYYRADVQEWAKTFVNNFGYPALFLLTWASDVIIQPIPADFFVFGSNFGGNSLIVTALVAGSSSAFGGSTGYFLGKWFGPWRFRRIFGSKVLRAGRDLFRKHGFFAIFFAGVSPIPYSAVCWIGGIYNTSLVEVILASVISRTIRYLVVGWITGFV
jgi:membrane protein YqaA with SNARE-associated domain